MSKKETRSLIVRDLEVREAHEEEKAVRVSGHALTFNDPYQVLDFMEQVAPEAVPDNISNRDVFAFWGHDSTRPLARTSNGTLKLSKDERGLAVDFTLPESAAYEAEAIRSGMVDKMSIGFIVTGQTWQERSGEPDLRTITEMELLEVSPVAIPANPNTDIAARAHQEWRSALDAAEGPETNDEAEKGSAYGPNLRDALERLGDAF